MKSRKLAAFFWYNSLPEGVKGLVNGAGSFLASCFSYLTGEGKYFKNNKKPLPIIDAKVEYEPGIFRLAVEKHIKANQAIQIFSNP